MKDSALWQLSFRPFFLFGSLWAIVAIALWIGFLLGVFPRPGALDPIVWHSHEMVFGFLGAIVAGFVLTAVQNWSGSRGPHGARLRALFWLWILARIAIAVPSVPQPVSASIDLAFFPMVVALLAPYLKDPELKVERIFLLFFALLFAGNALVHLEATGLDPFRFQEGTARIGVRLGLDTILLITLFMGGRVIPFFTESSAGRLQPRTFATVEILAPASAALFVALDLLARGTRALAIVAFAAALIHAIRLGGWQVRRVRRVPLIWVLHLGYVWLVLGFALSGAAALGWFAQSPATHAFTVGGLGIVVYGMISRVSLGHTGRRLHPSGWVVGGYVALAAAATARVAGPIFPGVDPVRAWALAGALWIGAFAVFVGVYAPMLFRPRVDGRPG